MIWTSHPVSRLSGTPVLPGDKSITHRAYLLGAMAEGTTEVLSPNQGEDCQGTLRAVIALGARVTPSEDGVHLVGTAGQFSAPAAPLALGNSGTSLRLLLGLLAAQPFTTVLAGDESLNHRPVERVLAPLRRMGARAEAPGDHPPVTLHGGVLQGAHHVLTVPSAQVKSALLLAGIQAAGTTIIEGGGTSRDHTERLLREFGVELGGTPDRLVVQGPSRLRAASIRVPGDPSAAAFYLAALAAVPESEVELEGMSLNPTRTKMLDVFIEMGLHVSITSDPASGEEPWGRLHARSAPTRAVVISPERVPPLIDELPALAVAAAFAQGTTMVRGAGELRVKESDRLRTVFEGLRAIGARATLLEDGWDIVGSAGRRLPGGEVRTEGDHRIGMAFLVAGLGCEAGVRLLDAPGITTSDPHFRSNLERILEGDS